MRNTIWTRVLAAGLVFAAPVAAQAQEVGIYFSVTPRADSPITGNRDFTSFESDAKYRPVGFVIVATHYYSDNWFGLTGEIGYSGADLRSEAFDFEGGLRMFTGLAGLRFRPPDSKNRRFHPSLHFMAGVAMFRSTTNNVFEVNNFGIGDFTPFPADPNPTSFAFSTGVAVDFEVSPGKAIGAQLDGIGTRPNGDLLIWRFAFGAVFRF